MSPDAERPDAEEPEEGEARLRPGTVTALTRQRRDPQRVNVFLDGAFALGLAEEVVVKAGLRKGRFLSLEALEGLRAEDAGLRARRLALDYLAHRARTRAEVRRRLGRAGFAEPDAEAAVARGHAGGGVSSGGVGAFRLACGSLNDRVARRYSR